MPRIWTRLHEHLGEQPGPITFEMIKAATDDKLEESDDLDWKEKLPRGPEDGRWNELAKDVAAMANTRGGLLIYGVTNSIKLRGISLQDIHEQQYRQWIRNHVQPYLPDLDMYALTSPDGTKTVFVIDVPASELAPHFVYGTAKVDKDQQAAVVPYRDKDHTDWMAEHQIERAYRDRFARVAHADEETRRHLQLTTDVLATQTPAPSAWFIAISRPQRPLPRGAVGLDRDQARHVLEQAQRAHHHRPAGFAGHGILNGTNLDILNPRPGLRRWVCSPPEGPRGREALAELHHDGTVIAAANLSKPQPQEPAPSTDQPLLVSRQALEACCYDLLALAQQLSRQLRLDSTHQLTATLLPPHGPSAMAPADAPFAGAREELVTYARHPHALQPVHAVLHPVASDEECRIRAEELQRDLLNQLGIETG